MIHPSMSPVRLFWAKPVLTIAMQKVLLAQRAPKSFSQDSVWFVQIIWAAWPAEKWSWRATALAEVESMQLGSCNFFCRKGQEPQCILSKMFIMIILRLPWYTFPCLLCACFEQNLFWPLPCRRCFWRKEYQRAFHRIQIGLSKSFEQHDQLKSEAGRPLHWPKLNPCSWAFATFPTQKVDYWGCTLLPVSSIVPNLSSLSEDEWNHDQRGRCRNDDCWVPPNADHTTSSRSL